MGSASQERQLFNLNQAKQYMQTLLHATTITPEELRLAIERHASLAAT
jgi:hypothetical protein